MRIERPEPHPLVRMGNSLQTGITANRLVIVGICFHLWGWWGLLSIVILRIFDGIIYWSYGHQDG